MNPAILLLVMALSGGPPLIRQESIDTCGWFEARYDSCFTFWTTIYSTCYEFGTHLESLPDSLLHNAVVRVSADVSWGNPFCNEYYGYYTPVLENLQIAECEPVDFGCGVLRYDGEYCYEWSSPTYGSFSTSSWHCFALGDTVRVTGITTDCIADFCFSPILIHDHFYPCGETPPAVMSPTWGAIKAAFK